MIPNRRPDCWVIVTVDYIPLQPDTFWLWLWSWHLRYYRRNKNPADQLEKSAPIHILYF